MGARGLLQEQSMALATEQSHQPLSSMSIHSPGMDMLIIMLLGFKLIIGILYL